MLRLVALALLATGARAQSATLHATLDLRGALEAGWLNPATETVGLRGSAEPLSWDRTTAARDPDGDGLYTVSVPFDLEGDSLRLEYKIKVDGAGNPNGGWQQGANHTVTLRADAGLEVALAWSDAAPLPPGVVTGTLESFEVAATNVLGARTVHVWLPPGYAASGRRYPVLYLHDGASVFGTEPGAEWGMDEAATALIEAGEIEPLLIVGVANTDRRTDEYTPTATQERQTARRIGPPTSDGPLGPLTGTFDADGDSLVVAVRDTSLVVNPPGLDLWLILEADDAGDYPVPGAPFVLSFERDLEGAVTHIVARSPERSGGLGDAYGALLTDTVKPTIDARYRTLPDAVHTGLGGASLGGLISMHLGVTRPDVFGRLIVASPSVWWDDKVILRSVAASRPSADQRVWVDIGLEEGGSMVPDARRLAELLVETGWDPALVRYVEAPGAGHETSTWQARAPDMLRFLFPAE